MTEPFIRHVCHQRFKCIFYAVEMCGENLVEAVKLRLIFYQTGTGEIIKVVNTLLRYAAPHCFKERQQFRYRRLQAALTEHEEKLRQHLWPDLPGVHPAVEKNQLFKQVHILFVLE